MKKTISDKAKLANLNKIYRFCPDGNRGRWNFNEIDKSSNHFGYRSPGVEPEFHLL